MTQKHRKNTMGMIIYKQLLIDLSLNRILNASINNENGDSCYVLLLRKSFMY